jgi:hypothetical protein
MTSETSRDRPAESSLIQQRIALRRERATGAMYLVIGVLGLAGSAALIAMTPSSTRWATLVAWLGFAGLGIGKLARYRRRVAAFESANGVGAGEQ